MGQANPQSDQSDLRALLAQRGLRCTKQRLAVFETLTRSRMHPTAEELYQIVNEKDGGLSRATVYNTLNALADAGLVRRMPCDNGLFRFDADLSEHIHVRYRESGIVRDLPHSLKNRLMCGCCRDALSAIAKDLGFQPDQITLEIIARGQVAAVESNREPDRLGPNGVDAPAKML